MSTIFEYDIDQINAVIKNRRSGYSKDYEKGKIISDKIIWQILGNAVCIHEGLEIRVVKSS